MTYISAILLQATLREGVIIKGLSPLSNSKSQSHPTSTQTASDIEIISPIKGELISKLAGCKSAVLSLKRSSFEAHYRGMPRRVNFLRPWKIRKLQMCLRVSGIVTNVFILLPHFMGILVKKIFIEFHQIYSGFFFLALTDAWMKKKLTQKVNLKVWTNMYVARNIILWSLVTYWGRNYNEQILIKMNEIILFRKKIQEIHLHDATSSFSQ